MRGTITLPIAARVHAQLLAENGKLSHQFADETSLPERLAATGARFTISAENVRFSAEEIDGPA